MPMAPPPIPIGPIMSPIIAGPKPIPIMGPPIPIAMASGIIPIGGIMTPPGPRPIPMPPPRPPPRPPPLTAGPALMAGSRTAIPLPLSRHCTPQSSTFPRLESEDSCIAPSATRAQKQPEPQIRSDAV